jgi:hypothetical protein
LVVALTVSFTVSDAQAIGLFRSCSLDDALSSLPCFASLQMERSEQKAPYDLAFTRAAVDLRIARALLTGTTSFPDNRSGFSYRRGGDVLNSKAFCCQVNACESPRAPPLMDPPFLS